MSGSRGRGPQEGTGHQLRQSLEVEAEAGGGILFFEKAAERVEAEREGAGNSARRVGGESRARGRAGVAAGDRSGLPHGEREFPEGLEPRGDRHQPHAHGGTLEAVKT